MDSLWINSAILYTVKLVPAQHFSLLPKYPSFPIPIKHLGIVFVPTYALLSLLPTIHIQVSPFPSTVIVLHFSFSVFQSLAFLFFSTPRTGARVIMTPHSWINLLCSNPFLKSTRLPRILSASSFHCSNTFGRFARLSSTRSVWV